MFRKIMILTLCLLLLTATACTQLDPVVDTSLDPSQSPTQPDPDSPTPTPSPDEQPTQTLDMTRVSDMLMQTETFSITLMQNLKNSYTDRNTLFSPLAFNTSIASLYAAAQGNTEEELRVMMGYNTEPEDAVATLTYLISIINSEHFTLGNSLHLSKRVGFSENYIDTVTSPLRISTYSQDYADLSTFKAINACAELITNGRVSSILQSTAAADTLYLLSAFNLSGGFDLPFDETKTTASIFETPTGLVNTQMMNGDFELGYAEDEYMQLVSLPMGGGAMQLKLILPREDGAVAFDEALIQYADAWLSPEALTQQAVTLSVPTFTLVSDADYTEILSTMGLSSALRAQTVDFSAMLNPDLTLPMPLNNIFSIGSMTVSENGVNTDATADPVVIEPTEESVEIAFDRPFMMAVTDTQSGALLAMGWVNTVNEAR